jgi:hypothetical protein
MGQQGEKEKASKKRKARGPRWALWETLLACHVVIAIRNKFAQGMGGPELMREYNRLYAELADEWDKNNLLLDHNGLPDRRVSVEMSKEHRISAVDSSTRKTPILRRFEDMVCKVRNELLPILDKKVLVDGKIPSGRQAQECTEELRVLYMQFLDKDGYKPASGDEDVEGEGGTSKTSTPMSSTSRANMGPLSSGDQVKCTFSKMRRTCRKLSRMALAAGASVHLPCFSFSRFSISCKQACSVGCLLET